MKPSQLSQDQISLIQECYGILLSKKLLLDPKSFCSINTALVVNYMISSAEGLKPSDQKLMKPLIADLLLGQSRRKVMESILKIDRNFDFGVAFAQIAFANLSRSSLVSFFIKKGVDDRLEDIGLSNDDVNIGQVHFLMPNLVKTDLFTRLKTLVRDPGVNYIFRINPGVEGENFYNEFFYRLIQNLAKDKMQAPDLSLIESVIRRLSTMKPTIVKVDFYCGNIYLLEEFLKSIPKNISYPSPKEGPLQRHYDYKNYKAINLILELYFNKKILSYFNEYNDLLRLRIRAFLDENKDVLDILKKKGIDTDAWDILRGKIVGKKAYLSENPAIVTYCLNFHKGLFYTGRKKTPEILDYQETLLFHTKNSHYLALVAFLKHKSFLEKTISEDLIDKIISETIVSRNPEIILILFNKYPEIISNKLIAIIKKIKHDPSVHSGDYTILALIIPFALQYFEVVINNLKIKASDVLLNGQNLDILNKNVKADKYEDNDIWFNPAGFHKNLMMINRVLSISEEDSAEKLEYIENLKILLDKSLSNEGRFKALIDIVKYITKDNYILLPDRESPAIKKEKLGAFINQLFFFQLINSPNNHLEEDFILKFSALLIEKEFKFSQDYSAIIARYLFSTSHTEYLRKEIIKDFLRLEGKEDLTEGQRLIFLLRDILRIDNFAKKTVVFEKSSYEVENFPTSEISGGVGANILAYLDRNDLKKLLVTTKSRIRIGGKTRGSGFIIKGETIIDKRVDEKKEEKTPEPYFNPADEESLADFNRVRDRSNLTHANIDAALKFAFVNIGGISLEEYQSMHSELHEVDIAVISSDESLDTSLIDSILRFINSENSQHCSIALCRGMLVGNKIVGDTHWTALSIDKIANIDGGFTIEFRHRDSIGQRNDEHGNPLASRVPEAVSRVIGKIRSRVSRDVVINDCEPVATAQQEGAYECGYHAVHNLLLARERFGKSFYAEKSRAVKIDETLKSPRHFIGACKVALMDIFNTHEEALLAGAGSSAGGGSSAGAGSSAEGVYHRGVKEDLGSIFSNSSYSGLDQLSIILLKRSELAETTFNTFMIKALNNCLLELRSKLSISDPEGLIIDKFVYYCSSKGDILADPSLLFKELRALLGKEITSKEALSHINNFMGLPGEERLEDDELLAKSEPGTADKKAGRDLEGIRLRAMKPEAGISLPRSLEDLEGFEEVKPEAQPEVTEEDRRHAEEAQKRSREVEREARSLEEREVKEETKVVVQPPSKSPQSPRRSVFSLHPGPRP
jgi:hypothetical protein